MELPHTESSPLCREGAARIDWAAREMHVLAAIRERFMDERPLAGLRVVSCLHVTTETANLLHTLQCGGAEVALVTCNPLTIQDPTRAALSEMYGIQVFAQPLRREYYTGILAALDLEPQIVIDDGGDLISVLHEHRPELADRLLGGTEETTSGIARLRAMQREGSLRFPVIGVNSADTKHRFDNRYGTGQSALDGVLRATNVLLAGKTVVVSGYGPCGRGLAERARGLGADVIVTEVSSVAALEAVMDGFRVMPLLDAAPHGDVFLVSTGVVNVVDLEHLEHMKDGAIIANAGHLDVEINVAALERAAVSMRSVRQWVDEYLMPDGRRVHLLCRGRLVNLVAAEGHPSAVMDLSFGNQALAVEHVALHHEELEPGLHSLPIGSDEHIAGLKLRGMGLAIDRPRPDQIEYLSSWRTPVPLEPALVERV